jgi:Glycosyl transferase family 2/N-terminal domain of galactosyltransferase
VLSVVIPAGGGAPRLRCTLACLAAALRAEAAEAEIIVVNDGALAEIRASVEHAAEHTGAEFQMVEIARAGRSAARNAGALQARGNRLLFIDSDILVEKEVVRFHAGLGPEAARLIYRGTIAHLPWLAAFEDPMTGAFTAEALRSLRIHATNSCLLSSRTLSREVLEDPSVLRTVARSTRFQRHLEQWFQDNAGDVASSWIGSTGGQISMDRHIFDQLGGFDEKMGMRWGAEDLEFGYRAAQSGIAIRYARNARCYHLDHGVSGREGDHALALEYFAAKHGNPGVMRLLDYFSGKCNLSEAMEACHVTA